MKVLVTGGSGFLGSHVADILDDQGHKVTILDKSKSKWLRDSQNFIEGTIENSDTLQEAVTNQDAIYHFAGIADIDDCLKHPIDTAKINVIATVKLADICLKKKIKRLFFGSTVYVYSRSGSFYRASKQSAESFLEVYKDLGLPLTILRYGSLYGPRASLNNSIKKILVQAMEKKHIVYKGTGDERREFIHVIDAARASVEMLSSEDSNSCITITGPDVFTYKEILNMICEMMPDEIKVEYQKSTKNEHYYITPYQYSPRSGKKFIINPFTDMGQGLLDFIESMKKE